MANPDGPDVERLLLTRDRFGTIDRDQLRPVDERLLLSAWLDVEASVLVLAAVSYAIDDASKVGADLIVEAANMPVTAAAEAQLAEGGVLLIRTWWRTRDQFMGEACAAWSSGSWIERGNAQPLHG
ncbi:hypothetical protein ALI144C_21090 [Actinosynnema sp. ALI-1.44]|uniref:hypothetical protein n=1 Tax=Actinosynnema sp. ALI-1.44 TaxID=1933779 RepID=UPI00097BE4CA|nr:hypothetical protein [Actinosynnema sp. ALI-1.44]ONI81054.1 hypothetical protein ALI144C_21090 [Actinosynnema sp. ALI-1.44]